MDNGYLWTMRDGSIIAVSEMGSRHLANAIAMLRRNQEAEESGYWQAGCMLQGEQAIDAWEAAYSSVEDEAERRQSAIEILETELARRAA